MGYWTAVPTAILKTKKLNEEEKVFYFILSTIINKQDAKRYCTDSNSELAKKMNISESTVSQRVSKLAKKHFANITPNPHKNERRIYLHVPGDPILEEPLPTNDEMDASMTNLKESFKQAIIFGNVPFEVLVQKLLETNYLDHVQDNSTQLCLNIDQINFLSAFHKMCPGKAIDAQLVCYPNVNYNKLINSIRESAFLLTNDNLSLKWCLEHASEICSGNYKQYFEQENTSTNFKGRAYTQEQLNSLFQDIEDLEIWKFYSLQSLRIWLLII